MRTNLFFRRLSGAFPYGYQRSSWFWPMTLGIGVGLAAGVGVGVLYAPRPGVETRRRLREGAERAKERARMTASRVKGELESSVAELREQARGMTSEIGHVQ